MKADLCPHQNLNNHPWSRKRAGRLKEKEHNTMFSLS
jgi:hypothetical protein